MIIFDLEETYKKYNLDQLFRAKKNLEDLFYEKEIHKKQIEEISKIAYQKVIDEINKKIAHQKLIDQLTKKGK
jgi:isopropylmalate/homocitrate/citramalate synthase